MRQLFRILKESPLFSSLSSKEYTSLLRHMEEYPLYRDSDDESATIGYEASLLFMNSGMKTSTSDH
jgi:hypothetical protein